MACAYGRNELALLWYAGHYVTGDVDTAYLQSLEDSVRTKDRERARFAVACPPVLRISPGEPAAAGV